MARITVEDCLKEVSNRFDLVMLATRRARALEKGDAVPKVEEESDQCTVIALREVAEGLVTSEAQAREEIIEDEFTDIYARG